MKKCIYTFIFGKYDSLKEPEVITPGWDYICFTNQNFQSDVWEIRKGPMLAPTFDGCHVAARATNLKAHVLVSEYDLSISIGGQITIKCDLDDFVARNFKDNDVIALRKHPHRKCTYEEGKACIRLKKDDPDIINEQMAVYRKDGLPTNAGMVETGVMIRRHNDKNLKEHSRLWWAEICNYSFRDQLSFNYILWKYKLIKPTYYKYDIFKKDFKLNKHDRRN